MSVPMRKMSPLELPNKMLPIVHTYKPRYSGGRTISRYVSYVERNVSKRAYDFTLTTSYLSKNVSQSEITTRGNFKHRSCIYVLYIRTESAEITLRIFT